MNLKLKHKKLIVIASLMVIGIGTLAFSLVNGKDDNKEVASNETASSDILSQEDAESQIASFTGKGTNQDTAEEETEAEAGLEFQVNEDPEIIELLTAYMNTKLEPSVEAFTPLVNDVSLIDVEAIDRETNIIEKYDNITVNSIDTPEEGTSLVYLYHDVKFIGIDTAAPAATRFLVVKEDDKAPYIFNGEIPEDIKSFIAEFEESNAYIDLVEEVNTKLLEALDKDQVLSEFYQRLYDQASAAEENTEEIEATETTESSESTETTASSEATDETQAESEGDSN